MPSLHQLLAFFRRTAVYLIFCGIYLTVSTSYVSDKFGFLNAFKITLLFATIQGSIAYINIIYLVPQLLLKNKVWLFSLLCLLSIALCMPLIRLGIELFFYHQAAIYEYYTKERGFLFYFVDCSIAVAGLSAIFYVNKMVMLSQKTENIKQQQLTAELNYLKTQINPHFLFNVLNSIYALTRKKSDDAPDAILKLSKMMRYMLHECSEPKVALKNEIEYLYNYIDLERLRHHANANIIFKVVGNVNGLYIAPLILLPFVENSFKHGITTSNKDFIHIYIMIAQNQLVLTVKNSKKSALLLLNATSKHSGIGLQNVKRRLKLIYPNQHVLDIYDNTDTHEVHLKLNIRKS